MTESKTPSKRIRKAATPSKASTVGANTTQDGMIQDDMIQDASAHGSAAQESAARSESPAKPSPREAAVEALMRLAAEQPWSDIEISDIAREAGLSLAELRDLFPSKGAVLGGLTRIIDRKVLEGDLEGLEEEPTRERLFDVLMRRLDAMEPYKPALRRIAYALRGEPLSMLAMNGVMLNSHRYMLAAAGIDTEGPLGQLKLQGVVIAFARVTQVWLDDDDPALARTMARLDKEIRNGERIMERAEDVRRLTAPLRALGRSFLDRRPRERRGRDGDETDPAAAI
ncbi:MULTISPECIES: TetR/AcrR family transcriptional regulator [Methylobacterium]|jgi:AcrR family transcriptional regulator|uniref:TetR/AcrR family transcriptional regulator n=1 Tax=Methylobacterium longum TaxID=767694 RepID=A0ABT8AXI9_9HYPH|nr:MULTISPECIES: TetR/AcrR family transcriptional regulator [Methylobacterium]MCJ2098347.1 TetR/AcrR family transcriptional regulator [Methylobacterium sp. E-046]MDN3574126.1 TetR/AcrR family transcriptional regulator [Methylobacterium longum]GJE11554.1 hypothetical protein FOHLNKBM_2597 [Methylobacterium longum]